MNPKGVVFFVGCVAIISIVVYSVLLISGMRLTFMSGLLGGVSFGVLFVPLMSYILDMTLDLLRSDE